MRGEWRTGRKVGRTIYVQNGDDPADGDRLIGMMDTPEMAALACAAVNRLSADVAADIERVANTPCPRCGVDDTHPSVPSQVSQALICLPCADDEARRLYARWRQILPEHWPISTA